MNTDVLLLVLKNTCYPRLFFLLFIFGHPLSNKTIPPELLNALLLLLNQDTFKIAAPDGVPKREAGGKTLTLIFCELLLLCLDFPFLLCILPYIHMFIEGVWFR